MQIVIDIPEEDYNFIKDLQFYNSERRSGKTIEKNIINGIKNGTVLSNYEAEHTKELVDYLYENHVRGDLSIEDMAGDILDLLKGDVDNE